MIATIVVIKMTLKTVVLLTIINITNRKIIITLMIIEIVTIQK